jgi:hypothetical protein
LRRLKASAVEAERSRQADLADALRLGLKGLVHDSAA